MSTWLVKIQHPVLYQHAYNVNAVSLAAATAFVQARITGTAWTVVSITEVAQQS